MQIVKEHSEKTPNNTPKGLIYCTRLMKRWLHGESPYDGLRMIKTIESLKKGSKERYFETLLETIFLQNKEKCYVVFTPEKGKKIKRT